MSILHYITLLYNVIYNVIIITLSQIIYKEKLLDCQMFKHFPIYITNILFSSLKLSFLINKIHACISKIPFLYKIYGKVNPLPLIVKIHLIFKILLFSDFIYSLY